MGTHDLRRRDGKEGGRGEAAENLPENQPAGGSIRDNPYSVRPSSSRHAFDSDRNEISYVEPVGDSTETRRQYARRQESNDYAYNRRKSAFHRKIVIAVIIAIASLAVAATVGYYVYMGTLDNDLHDGLDGSISAQLKNGDPSSAAVYILMTGKCAAATEPSDRLDCIMLIRLDVPNSTITMVSIPTDTRVRGEDGSYCRLVDIYENEGPGAFVRKVHNLLDVNIDHYVEFSSEDAVSIVEAAGGLDATVPENTVFNGVSIPAGSYTLDGNQAYVLFNCRKVYTDGDATRMKNQQSLMTSFIGRVGSAGSSERWHIRKALSACLSTDLSLDQLETMGQAISGAGDGLKVYACTVPYTSRTSGGEMYAVVSSDEWSSMYAAVNSGSDPAALQDGGGQAPGVIVPSSFQVTVRNGSGVKGCAAQAADRLSSAGYVIVETGNANSFVYDETLVVYNDDADANVAADVVDKLGVGRAVQNPGSYTFDGDILVMVGRDWIP